MYLRYPYSANMNPPILSKFKQSSNSPVYVHVSPRYSRACQLNDMMIEKILALLSLSPYIPAASASPFHIRFNFSKEKRSENNKNCVNNLQEKKEAIGEIDRHRLTDIICILTISKIKLVEVVLPNVHLRYSD